MITNDRQYRITRARLGEFEQALEEFERTERPPDITERIWAAQRDAMKAQLSDLEREIGQYVKVKSLSRLAIKGHSLRSLASELVQLRVFRNYTQRILAKKLDLKEQQVQRYEATDYSGISLERAQDILDALEGSFSFTIDVHKGQILDRRPGRHLANRTEVVRRCREAQLIVSEEGLWAGLITA